MFELNKEAARVLITGGLSHEKSLFVDLTKAISLSVNIFDVKELHIHFILGKKLSSHSQAITLSNTFENQKKSKEVSEFLFLIK